MSEEKNPTPERIALQEFAEKIATLMQVAPAPSAVDGGFYVASLFVLFFNFLSRIEYCHWCAMRDGKKILHDFIHPVDCETEIDGRWRDWRAIKSRHAEMTAKMAQDVSDGKLPFAADDEAEEYMMLSLVSLYNHYDIDMFKITNKAIKMVEALNKSHQAS